jgi:signal transduction histidine kinase
VTRLYFQTGRIRVRMILVVLACLIGFGLANIGAYWAFFDLSREQLVDQILLFSVMLSLIAVLLSGYIWTYLKPVAAMLTRLQNEGLGSAGEDEAARRAALRFPLTFAGVALIASVVGVVAGLVLDATVMGFPLPFAVTLGIATITEAAAVCAFIYVAARNMMRPIIAHFRHEEVPSGVRVAIRSKVSFAIILLSLLASIPTALIFSGRLTTIESRSSSLSRIHLAEAVAHGASALSSEDLSQAAAAARLQGDARILFTDTDSPAAAPLPPGHGRAYVTVAGSPPRRGTRLTLLVLVVLLLGLSTFVGRQLGDNLSHDVRLVSNRLRVLAEAGQEDRQKIKPLLAEAPQFSDLRQLADAVNALLDRFVELTVTQFLAIEKTLEADQVKTQFLANVSHDLRSPLNSVLGFSELLLRLSGEDLNDKQKEQLATINRCGGELLLLINAVLDTAKIQAGRVSLSREDSLPAELLSKALDEVRRRRAIPDSVQIETELQAGMQAVMVDPHRLIQAMSLIISFCVESMDQGRIVVQLRAQKVRGAGREERQVLRFRVATTSGGLVESEVKRLFAGFQRKPGQRGLGLGLPLAKAFIEMHDGELNLHSNPRIGTTFTAEIPIIQQKVLARLLPRKK